MSDTTQAPAPAPVRSLVEKFASKYLVDAGKLVPILKATAFRVSSGEVSDAQMAALMIVADQYGLNPFTREIFAFEDKFKGIVPVVSVDGWARIINEHVQLDGFEFNEIGTTKAPHGDKAAFEAIECVIYRKDRKHPTKVKEFFSEVYQPPRGQNQTYGPWQSHPKRMHRHKALIQCARLAFGFAGIYDEDEAERILQQREVEINPPPGGAPQDTSAASRMAAHLGAGKQEPAPDGGWTVEGLKLAIESAEDSDALGAILPKINTLPAGKEREELMKDWNAATRRFAPPAPKEPAKPAEAPAAAATAPEPKRAVGAPSGGLPQGTQADVELVVSKFKAAATIDALDDAADHANKTFAWSRKLLGQINKAYSDRHTELSPQ